MNGLKPKRYLAMLLTASMLTACGGGGSGGGGTTPSATPTPTPGPYTCPSADSTTAVATSGGSAGTESVRRISPRRGASAGYAPSLLAVQYSTTYLNSAGTAVGTRELTAGAQFVKQLDFPALGRSTRVLGVSPSNLQSVASQLRLLQGVQNVSQVGLRRTMLVAEPYFTNDPYFAGFAGSSAPYYEAASIPGQWDMHAVKLEYAFAYSQAGDAPAGYMNANALGSSSIRIAIIDTGEDTAHPELSSKIAYQKCFITNTNNVQSTSDFTTDPNGHGTDVSGIAAADINNDLGFVGAGGNVKLDAYRVFPTPDSYTNCGPGSTNTTDMTCTATTTDIADAINDAVSQGAKVISLSLGGTETNSNSGCNGGVDQDPTEGSAIANAIASNVVVVAAAGNAGASGGAGVEAPACDTGVIAAGASALADGPSSPNGSGNLSGSAASPAEYVASYSQYGTPAKDLHSSAAWGIVAPGGDPSGDGDADDLHWIENIWTSTPYTSQDDGTCTGDYPNDTGTTDCRTLIAGTSMATPHVAGAAALIESVTSTYSTPAAMKRLLCSTADDINDPHEGCGRLNIYRAMATALGDPNLP